MPPGPNSARGPVCSNLILNVGSKRPPNGDNLDQRVEAHLERVRASQVEQKNKSEFASRQAEHVRLEQGFDNWSTTSKKKRGEPRQMPLLAAKIHREVNRDEDAEPLSKLLSRDKTLDSSPDFVIGDEVEVRDKDMVEWRAGLVSETAPLKVTLLEWDQAFQWDSVRRRETTKLKQMPAQSVPVVMNVQPASQCTCGYRFLKDAIFCSRCGSQRGCEVANSMGTPIKPPRPPVLPGPARQGANSQDGSVVRRASAPNPHRKLSPAPVAETKSPCGDTTKSPLLPRMCGSCGGVHPVDQYCPPLSAAQLEPTRTSRFRPASSSGRGRSVYDVESAPVLRDENKRPSTYSRSHSAETKLSDCDLPELSGGNSVSSSSKHISTVLRDSATGHIPRQLGNTAMFKQKWQQFTVPILAEDGQVISLRPSDSSKDGVWQQYTVPIMGEDGDVIALRPAVGSSPLPQWKQSMLPIFDDHGELTGLPKGGMCEWPQNTIPILADDGEVIGLRSKGEVKYAWKQKTIPIFGTTGEVVAVCPAIGNLQKWEQLTVPLVAENGEVVGLRPSGERYDMPAWCRGGASANPPLTARERRDARFQATSSSIGSDRTLLPPAQNLRHQTSSNSTANAEKIIPDSSPCSSVRTLRLTDSRASSPRPAEAIPVANRKPEKPRKGLRESWEVVSVGDGESLGAGLFDLSDSTPWKSPLTAAAVERQDRACVPKQLVMEMIPSPSASSVDSINEILRMANVARQATPEGHMLQVLKDALGSDTHGSITTKDIFSLPHPPEADELVMRIRQLPELWRGTLLQMLEQAEAVQVPADDGTL